MDRDQPLQRLWSVFKDATVVFTNSNHPQNCLLCQTESGFVSHSHLSPKHCGGFSIETIRRFDLDEVLRDSVSAQTSPIPDKLQNDPVQTRVESQIISSNLDTTIPQPAKLDVSETFSRGPQKNGCIPDDPPEDETLPPLISGTATTKNQTCQETVPKISDFLVHKKLPSTSFTQSPSSNQSPADSTENHAEPTISKQSFTSSKSETKVESLCSDEPFRIVQDNCKVDEKEPQIDESEKESEVSEEFQQLNGETHAVLSQEEEEEITEASEGFIEDASDGEGLEPIGNFPSIFHKKKHRLLRANQQDQERFTEKVKLLDIDESEDSFDFEETTLENIKGSFSNDEDDDEDENTVEINSHTSHLALLGQVEAVHSEEKYQALSRLQRRVEAERLEQERQDELDKKYQENAENQENEDCENLVDEGDGDVERTVEKTQKSSLSFVNTISIPMVTLSSGDEVICFVTNMSSDIDLKDGVGFYVNVLESRKLFNRVYKEYYQEIVDTPNVFNFEVGDFLFCLMDDKYHRIQILNSSFTVKIALLDEGMNMEVMSEQYLFKPIVCDALKPDRIAPLAIRYLAVGFGKDVDTMGEAIESHCNKKTIIKSIIQSYNESDESYVVSFDNICALEEQEIDVACEFYMK